MADNKKSIEASKEENAAYLRNLNDYLGSDKNIGEEISFVSGKEVINIIKTQEFEDAVKLLDESNKSVFITGKAGTGKSTLLKYFRSKSQKECAVLAFTGLAAINAGGETIHSFFQFPIGFIPKRTIKANKRIQLILRSLNTIVLDEVSMLRADLMDAIDMSLQKNRENSLPFGGVQMIFIGDLHQLPPIIEKDLMPVYKQYYTTPFFFSAHVFSEFKIKKIDLQKIHRQTDPFFVDLLNNIREKKHVEASIAMLNRNIVNRNFLIDLQTSGYVILCTINERARVLNEYYMSKINAPIIEYTAKVSGLYDPASYPTEEVLQLKEGSKVMFIRNDNELGNYVNGDIGIVSRLMPNSILIETPKAMISVDQAIWNKFRYDTTYIDVTNEDGTVGKKRIVTKVVVGSFTQYPLKLAWAISIHKSQGQTYDKVLIDFANGCFTSGQAYVALSRCRTWEGVKLRKHIQASDVILDNRIYQLENIIDNEPENFNIEGE